MAAIRANKPYGDRDIKFESPGGTFGNMWPNGEPQTDAVVFGGGTLTVNDETVWEYQVTIAGGGDFDTNFTLVYRYTGSPLKAKPQFTVGPTQATLARPV